LARDSFYQQSKLMLECLPYVFQTNLFALKGGTAINFFIRNMPRLSVDIDLTYLPINERTTALGEIESELKEISKRVKSSLPNSKVAEPKDSNGMIHKLLVSQNGVEIKIETNPVIRSAVHEVEYREPAEKVQDEFEMSFEIPTLSFEDLYGGKICAALDRQHPRDLFDIKYLFDHEGITEKIRKTFIAYLISHKRPLHEVLKPNEIDISRPYQNEFSGMVNENVSLETLLEVRKRLISEINSDLTSNERLFLIGFQNTTPDWSLLDLNIKNLPSVRWKLLNLEKLKANNPKRHTELGNSLREKLNL